MVPCPNIRSQEFTDLEKEFGREKAWLASHRNGGDPPTIERARDLLVPRKGALKGTDVAPLRLGATQPEPDLLNKNDRRQQRALDRIVDDIQDNPASAERTIKLIQDPEIVKAATPLVQEAKRLAAREQELFGDTSTEGEAAMRAKGWTDETFKAAAEAHEAEKLAHDSKVAEFANRLEPRLGASNPDPSNEDEMWAGFLKQAEQAKSASAAAVPSDLQSIYASQAKRSSSTMVDVQDTWKAYQKANPKATKAEFVAQMTALNKSGKILVEPLEYTQDLPDDDKSTLIPQKAGAPGAFWKPAPGTTLRMADPGGAADDADYLRHFQPGANSPDEDKRPISIKNEAVDAQREARGLPPRFKPARRTFGQVWDQAMAKVQAHDRARKDGEPRLGEVLVNELKTNPRPLSDLEDAILTYEQARRQQDQEDAVDALNTAADQFSKATTTDAEMEAERQIATASQWLANARDAVFEVYEVGQRAGTENGRGLNARKLAIQDDYTLTSMQNRRRAALGGKRLSPEQEAELASLHKRIEELEAKNQKLQREKNNLRTRRNVDTMRADVFAGRSRAKGVGSRLADMEAQALAWLASAEALGASSPDTLGASRPDLPDDPKIRAYATIGASTWHSTQPRAAWDEEMIEKLGEKIRPQLDDIFDASQKFYNAIAGAASRPEQVTSAFRQGEMPSNAEIRDLALAHIAEGKGENTGALLDAVHTDLAKIVPGVTRREISDAISGYGKATYPSENENRRQLAELSSQLRLLSQYEDAMRGEAPLRTGFQPGEPSAKVRAMQREVRDLMRKMKVKVTDEKRQQKTALAGAKTRLRNIIADLAEQIAAGKKTPKREGFDYDDEAKDLKAQADVLRQNLRDIEGPQKVSDEQRLKTAIAAVDKSIQWYEDRIKRKDVSPRPKSAEIKNAALEAKRKLRDSLQEAFNELKDAANPKLTPEQRALRNLKSRLRRSLAEVNRRIQAKDFSKRPKKEVAMDEEALKSQSELEKVRKDFRRLLEKDRLSKLGKPEKALRTLVKYRRAFLISGLAVLEKLLIAANVRLLTTPIEDAVAGAARHLPFVGKIIRQSPRYGAGFSAKVEAMATADGFINAVKNMPDRWQTGKSWWENLYGSELGDDFHDLDPFWLDFIGHIHMIMKSPAVEAEFSRSYKQRERWAVQQSIDTSTDAWKFTNGVAAYADSQRAKLMQKNIISDAWNSALLRLEQKGASGVGLANIVRLIFPLMKVSTNFAIEAAQYSPAGLAYTMLWETPQAMIADFDKLPPEERAEIADGIARHWAKGSIGLALVMIFLATGMAAKFAGGYFTKNKNQAWLKPEQIKGLPATASHTPALEGTLQFAATVQNVLSGKHKHKEDEPGSVGAATTAFLGLLGHLPAMDIPARLLEYKTPEGAQNLPEFATSFLIPQISQDIAKATDRKPGKDPNPKTATEMLLAPNSQRVERKPKGFAQSVKAAIPWARQTVPTKEQATESKKRPRWAAPL